MGLESGFSDYGDRPLIITAIAYLDTDFGDVSERVHNSRALGGNIALKHLVEGEYGHKGNLDDHGKKAIVELLARALANAERQGISLDDVLARKPVIEPSS